MVDIGLAALNDQNGVSVGPGGKYQGVCHCGRGASVGFENVA